MSEYDFFFFSFTVFFVYSNERYVHGFSLILFIVKVLYYYYDLVFLIHSFCRDMPSCLFGLSAQFLYSFPLYFQYFLFFFASLCCAVLLFHAVVVVASIWFAKTMYVCTIICLSKHSFKLEFLNCCCKHTQAHCVHSPRTKLHWKKLYVSIVTQSTHAYSHARRISLIFRLDIQYMFFSSLFHLFSPFFSLHSLSSSFFLFFFFFFLLPSFSLCVCVFFVVVAVVVFYLVSFVQFVLFPQQSSHMKYTSKIERTEKDAQYPRITLSCRYKWRRSYEQLSIRERI